jgi:hypothetical protein
VLEHLFLTNCGGDGDRRNGDELATIIASYRRAGANYRWAGQSIGQLKR